jgi:excisionase family DNA binding protein
MDEILDTKKAAKRLKISERRVRELCEMGRIPAFKVGRDWAILAKNLKRVTVYGKPGRPRKVAA